MESPVQFFMENNRSTSEISIIQSMRLMLTISGRSDALSGNSWTLLAGGKLPLYHLEQLGDVCADSEVTACLVDGRDRHAKLSCAGNAVARSDEVSSSLKPCKRRHHIPSLFSAARLRAASAWYSPKALLRRATSATSVRGAMPAFLVVLSNSAGRRWASKLTGCRLTCLHRLGGNFLLRPGRSGERLGRGFRLLWPLHQRSEGAQLLCRVLSALPIGGHLKGNRLALSK